MNTVKTPGEAENVIGKIAADKFLAENCARKNQAAADEMLRALDLSGTWIPVGWQYGDAVGPNKDLCPYVVLFENSHGKRIWFHVSKYSLQSLAEKTLVQRNAKPM